MIEVTPVKVIFHQFLRHAHRLIHRCQDVFIKVHGGVVLGDRAIISIAEPLFSEETLLIEVVNIHIA